MSRIKLFSAKYIWQIATYTLFIVLLAGCSRQEGPVGGNGEASLRIQEVRIEQQEQELGGSGNKASARTGAAAPTVQYARAAFSEDFSIDLQLTRETGTPDVQEGRSPRSVARSSETRAALQTTPLPGGKKYRLLVFDDQGDYVTERDYTKGSESATQELRLDAGKQYTFIGVANYSGSSLPTVSGKSKLATAAITSTSEDVLYFRAQKTLQFGENNLSIVLKHQFNLITTRIVVDPSARGMLTNIQNVSFGTGHTSANIQFSNGGITFNGAHSVRKTLTFPALGAGVLQTESQPVLLIGPAQTSASLTIGSMTIAGVTRNNITFSGLTIAPGQKYTLTLTMRTCTLCHRAINVKLSP